MLSYSPVPTFLISNEENDKIIKPIKYNIITKKRVILKKDKT